MKENIGAFLFFAVEILIVAAMSRLVVWFFVKPDAGEGVIIAVTVLLMFPGLLLANFFILALGTLYNFWRLFGKGRPSKKN